MRGGRDLCLGFLLILQPASARADLVWTRDPFQRFQVRELSAEEKPKLTQINCPKDWTLDGIISGMGGEMQAFISGELLTKGEKHGGFEVVSIQENQVRLQSNHKFCILKSEEI